MFKQLDEWMNDLEQELLNDYRAAAKARRDWIDAIHQAQRSADLELYYDIRDRFKSDYRGYCITKVTSRVHEAEAGEIKGVRYYALIDDIQIDNVYYSRVIAFGAAKDSEVRGTYSDMRIAQKRFEEQLDTEHGFAAFLRARHAYAADVALVEGRDDEWIVARAHKDMLAKKRSVEAKISKICDSIETISDECGEIYVKGTNGRIAHLWRILAGGYNVQRLHSRVLCKEIKRR